MHGRVEPLRLRGVALGILPRAKFESILQETTVTLAPGDLVFGYSDGVNEAHDATGQMYGDERVYSFGVDHAGLAPGAFLAKLRA